MNVNKCAGVGCVKKLICHRYDESLTTTLHCQEDDHYQFQQMFQAKDGYHKGYTHFFSRPTNKFSFNMFVRDLKVEHVDNMVSTLVNYDSLGDCIIENYNAEGLVTGYIIKAFKAEHKNGFQIVLDKDFK